MTAEIPFNSTQSYPKKYRLEDRIMNKVVCREEKVWIETYPEAEREVLPMFAENRVHQRTSGNPYPNKVVLKAQRDIKEKREYTVITLENEYIELAILPDLGGKIWYAKDKTKNYHFIYKNNVVKPALIGVLGSWTSGGMEFNWPFHHRASTFMPVDYVIEQTENEVTVWISEHDPIDRMKGMVGICLKAGECIFETKVKVDNITPVRHPFLWWENTAVPVNESYEIFFPRDVNYVHFHYKRSVTTFPIANNDRFGAFNGIYYDGNTDIGKHKNTKDATSYFSANSKYDYFGGYDNGVQAGIVHIADHHISPGKKMFTWAYSQLSKTWENALTDTDGQYAELMAGCYSDNQPDFAWLEANETKSFSQKWYPIHDFGVPAYANENGALFFQSGIVFQAVKNIDGAEISIIKNGEVLENRTIDLPCYQIVTLTEREDCENVRVMIRQGNKKLLDFCNTKEAERNIPAPRKELPNYKDVDSAMQLYIEGVHMEQYRSPEYRAETCYLEALKKDDSFAPAAIALAETYYLRFEFDKALEYAEKAESVLTRYNTRLESGKLYYLKGLILCALKKYSLGYDYFYKASWNYDYVSPSMLRIGLLDLRNGDTDKAIEHFSLSLKKNVDSPLANAFLGYAYYASGDKEQGLSVLKDAIKKDKLNLFAYAFIAIIEEEYQRFASFVQTDITQVLCDIIGYMYEAGLTQEIISLIKGVALYKDLGAMPLYTLKVLSGEKNEIKATEGIAFPSRIFEKEILEEVITLDEKDMQARYLLGCLLYGKGIYKRGGEIFEDVALKTSDYKAYRNAAVAYYSHLNDSEKAKEYMLKAVENAPYNERQMTFEYAYFMAKVGAEPQAIIDFILSRDTDRDELIVELARAYNHAEKPEKALNVLLERQFVACEGGEHYIADQYMYAHYLLGKNAYLKGDYNTALKEFQTAQVLPQSLGSGLWNAVKKVPYQYFEAMCYDKLGNKEKAKEVVQSYLHFDMDYFTDMYLYTFAYYLARAYQYLGELEKANEIVRNRILQYEMASTVEDTGFFGTTPFFISYVDQPKTARALHFAYPLYLFARYTGNKKDVENYKSIIDTDKYGMYIDDFIKE